MSLDNLTFGKEKILQIIKQNLEKHKEEYEEIYSKWVESIEKEIKNVAKNFKADKVLETSKLFSLIEPECHIKDYETVISLLEHCIESSIELNHHDYKKYMLDDWEWKQNFEFAKTFYSNNKI